MEVANRGGGPGLCGSVVGGIHANSCIIRDLLLGIVIASTGIHGCPTALLHEGGGLMVRSRAWAERGPEWLVVWGTKGTGLGSVQAPPKDADPLLPVLCGLWGVINGR